MLLTSSLHNALLQVIREKLIPWTQEQCALQMMFGQPPLSPPTNVRIKRYAVPPLREAGAGRYPRNGVFYQHWGDAGFHTSRFPCLGCILDGEADLEVCTTESMVAQSGENDGQGSRYILMLPKRTFFLIPAGVPHNNGVRLHWDRPNPELARSQILWIYIMPAGAVCHTCQTRGTDHSAHPSLFVRDSQLAILAQLLLEEMEEGLTDYKCIAQAYLIAFFHRLQRNLAAGRPLATDRALRVFPSGEGLEAGNVPTRVLSLQRACAYIRGHLDEPLSPPVIARHAYVSPSHLNRIFDAELGLSVMKYVTQCRIETAKSLLEGTDLAVEEISQLVGYKYISHFSQTFSQWTKLSPVAFRKQQAALQDRP
ncbi:MAG: helix-turn-helix transcriptional regulator [Abitibacteriaceae bacterium]|nr:helix-turn-helix transcriptional regulator [Abditibacteriaceae bacterium]